jgi:hypothetical protein
MSIYGNFRRYVPVFALVALMLAALACGETTPTSEPKVSTATSELAETQALLEQATNTPEPTAEPIEASTDTPEPQPVYLGDLVEQYGYMLSAIAVEDPTTPGMFYEPESGKKLVAIEVIVGNASGETLSVNPLNATLVDSEGFTYQTELAGRDGQIVTVDLGPGEKARGWIAFEVPEGAIPASIKYAVETFGSRVLQASLTQPPEGYVPDTEALSAVPPEPEAKLGDVFEQYGYSLSATAVEDPTTPGMLYEAQTGYKLVAVEMVVGNVSGETLSVNPLYVVLADSNGFVYQPELAGRDGQIATVDLNAGEKAKGWVAFSIPEGATPASVKYVVEMFSDKFLQAGLTQ